MLVINQRNTLGSNIRRGNWVTQADKSCLSLGIWMVFPQHITGDIWLHTKHQGRNIREKIFTRSVLRLLAFSLQAILWVNPSFLVLPWIWQVRELHASTLRWLTQLLLALEWWVKESEWEPEMHRPERLCWSNESVVSFFGGQGAQPKPVLCGEKQNFFRISFFNFHTCSTQSPWVVPIHWRVVLWRLALLHNDPVSLARCKILAQHSMRNWRGGGQCYLAMSHHNDRLSMKFLNAAARCLLLG